MKYSKFFKLIEKKDHLIKKMDLTDEQKQTIIDFFAKYPSYESEIDWNRKDLSWEDFEKVINKDRNTKSQIKKAVKKGISGIKEGVDYIDLGSYTSTHREGTFQMYIPLSWKGSRVLASDQVAPKLGTFKEGYTGAKWCISYQKSDDYWSRYSADNFFVFIFSEDIPSKKIAVQIGTNVLKSKETFSVKDLKNFFTDNIEVKVWNSDDNTINFAIEDQFNPYFKKLLIDLFNKSDVINKHFLTKIKKIKSLYVEARKLWIEQNINPKTGLVDIEGDVSIAIGYTHDELGQLIIAKKVNNNTSRRSKPIPIYVTVDGEEVPVFAIENGTIVIPFGNVSGSFSCGSQGLTSLKNSPQKVGGDFYAGHNKLTSSLEGAPTFVGGDFSVSYNSLVSLEGSPEFVGGHFEVGFNKITSFKGISPKIGKSVNCFKNKLESLEGLPKELNGSLEISFNKELTSLKGCSPLIKGALYCADCNLKTLEGCAERIEGSFDCESNKLTSFKGGPKYVGGFLNANDNLFTSIEDFKDAPKYIGKDFIISYCPNLELSQEDVNSIANERTIYGNIYK